MRAVRQHEISATESVITTSTDQYALKASLIAFDLDIFGRIKALSDAALANYLATEQGQRSIKISLIATVAETYLNERLLIEQLQISQRTLKDWQDSLDLARLLYQAGQYSEVDVTEAQSLVQQAVADIYSKQRQLKRIQNTLALLTGIHPDDPDLAHPDALNSSTRVTNLPVGLPFKEVLDGLAGLNSYSQELNAQEIRLNAAKRRVTLTTQRFAAGINSRLELLDAQRELYTVHQLYITTQYDQLTNIITLYRSLGGGWH